MCTSTPRRVLAALVALAIVAPSCGGSTHDPDGQTWSPSTVLVPSEPGLPTVVEFGDGPVRSLSIAVADDADAVPPRFDVRTDAGDASIAVSPTGLPRELSTDEGVVAFDFGVDEVVLEFTVDGELTSERVPLEGEVADALDRLADATGAAPPGEASPAAAALLGAAAVAVMGQLPGAGRTGGSSGATGGDLVVTQRAELPVAISLDTSMGIVVDRPPRARTRLVECPAQVTCSAPMLRLGRVGGDGVARSTVSVVFTARVPIAAVNRPASGTDLDSKSECDRHNRRLNVGAQVVAVVADGTFRGTTTGGGSKLVDHECTDADGRVIDRIRVQQTADLTGEVDGTVAIGGGAVDAAFVGRGLTVYEVVSPYTHPDCTRFNGEFGGGRPYEGSGSVTGTVAPDGATVLNTRWSAGSATVSGTGATNGTVSDGRD